VEVSDMSEIRSRKKLLAAGAAGAALSAAILVTVYENADGQVELAPGERGKASAGPPAKLEGTMQAAARPATPNDSDALQARARELEQHLQQAKHELAETQSQLDESIPHAPGRFESEERDSSWAPALEEQIQDRMTRFLGVEPGSAAVECRRTCCEIVLDSEELVRVQDELQSDVGLRHLYNQTETVSLTGDGDRVATTICLPSDDRELRTGQPDRGVEREALLTAARPAIDACMRGARTPLTFTTVMGLDATGEIDRLESEKSEPPDHPALECVERALVGAARFAPSDRWSLFLIELHLEPVR
jgi:hypothetical protein